MTSVAEIMMGFGWGSSRCGCGGGDGLTERLVTKGDRRLEERAKKIEEKHSKKNPTKIP